MVEEHFSEKDFLFSSLKTLEAFSNLNEADFSWELRPENKCMISVVKILQRGSVIIFRVNVKRTCRETWLEEQRME